MEIKKLKKIKNQNYIQCYAMKKIEILIKNVVVKINNQKNKREIYIQCYGENMENFENSFLLLIGECRQDKKIKIKKIKIMFYIQCYEIKKLEKLKF